jgi:mono/diheme cytochrome c family protein
MEEMAVPTQKIKLLLVATVFVSTTYLALSAQTTGKPANDQQTQLVKRGKYLVLLGGCNDCHSPKVFTAQGPIPDTTKPLSGAPADNNIPAVPTGVLSPDKWGFLGSNDMTTWAGPWGISFASNLTPDQVTGSGAWTEAAFMKAMRTGKHLGAGRDILPPMPWQAIGQLPDADLKAIFAYLRSIKPVENMVHLLVPPSGN